MIQILTYALIGLAGGLSSGLFGVGGGAVFVPLLVFLCHINMHLAIGTSIAVVIPTALIGVYRHGSAGMINWKIAILMAVFSIVGAWIGSGISLKLDTLLLKRFFAIFLVAVALKLFFSKA